MKASAPSGPASAPWLLGHEPAEAAFAQSLAADRMPHAWLISGPRGVGKATLAYRMVRRLLAEPAEIEGCQEPTSAVFRMVAGRHHPDLKVIDEPLDPDTKRLKANIPVELVRRRVEELRQTAVRGGRRVLLLDPLTDLGLSAANALLKLLEEPPDGLVLILIEQSYVRLPATIASRCARLRLRPLEPDLAARVIRRLLPEISETRAGIVAELANGSVGRALELEAIDWPTEYGRLLAELGQGTGRVLACSETLLRLAGKGGVLEAGRLLGDVLRRAALTAAGRPPRHLLATDELAMLGALPGAASLDRCVALWDKLAASVAETDRLHLDPLQTLVGVVHGLVAPPAAEGPGRRP